MADFAKTIFGFSSLKKDDEQSKIFPKNLANTTPTTAITDNSLVYGTTSNNNEEFTKTFKQQNNFQLNSNFNQNNENHNHLHNVPTFQSTITSPDGDPVIITTDETGQTMNQSNPAPKGKLKVTILEANNLLIHSPNSQPYVVCTFESSEFVTNAPGSFSKSPMVKNNLHSNHTNSNPRNLYQRQSSSNHLTMSDYSVGVTNPIWNHEAMFDVVGNKSEIDISIYDAATDDSFLGHVRIQPFNYSNRSGNWFNLSSRVIGERVSGSIKIKWEYTSIIAKTYGPEDFEILRLLGKGTFGRVYQVKKKDNNRIYAMKVLSKKVIVKKKEIAHTIGERNILVRTSAAQSPFIVGLKFSFQTPTDLYLVTDYMSGGELFWHLQKEGRFPEDRAKFYIAELVLALEHLHDNDIVYRDLKPENILLDANGHIVLCDFGLSKANLNNDGTTNTFCGTTEYLAPEVLLDESGYTKMVDFWSLGVLIFEMCCGWSPFYAENTQQMYKNIAFGKVRFPKEILSPEGRSFVKGLLNRNPKHRLGSINDARELKAHPFFNDIDWELLKIKSIPPPFKPHLSSETDTSNFDPEFTNESTSVLKKQMELASTPLSPGIQANFKGFTYVDASAMDDHFGKSHRMNTFKNPGSFIPGNPNLPPDEDVIDDDQIDEEDEDEMEIEEDEEFINGRFDL
ncbi:serine/threonine-protein kinase Sch9p [[Candida] jaroonii]|uniref:Serine/threonine-protein kinase Sch9p n=1 Tax=[Candida] jaroonii TaxID=467808 RepID=A0ACA9YF59_9ASCO|nr:serine/threonine-protein kinase Sch9p [[Candida] jaroonii]